MTATVEEKKAGITLDPQRDLMLAYATPIVNTNVGGTEALNAGLKKIILEKKESEKGIRKSNAGGWHSETDFFLWDHPEIHTLEDLQ